MSLKEARRMDLFIHYGMAAGLQAWRDCGLQVTPENAERIGVNYGSGIGGLPLIESMKEELDKDGPRRISPFFIPGSIINMIAGLLSIEIGAKGPKLAMVTACTTSTHCIGAASKTIRYGEADVMGAGGPEDGDGGFRAMRNAVRDGSVDLAHIDYINAHGTSTPLGDVAETIAVKRLLGDRAHKVAVNSTKSMTGHLLGAAGGVEAVFTALALLHQISPPTINLRTPDPACDLDYVPNAARKMPIRVAMSNSFGFGGTNGTLVLGRP